MRKCRNCEIDISDRHGKALYCSDACADFYRSFNILSKTQEKKCKNCQDMFKPRPYHEDDQLFCTNQCAMEHLGSLRSQGLLQYNKDEENITNLVNHAPR